MTLRHLRIFAEVYRTRNVLRGQKPLALCDRCPCFGSLYATGGARLCSTKHYLRFWLSICRTSHIVSALRMMRYCLSNIRGVME